MILQSLVNCYETLAENGKVARPGWSPAKVSFALNIAEDGSLLGVIDLRSVEEGAKKAVLRPEIMEVPEQVEHGVNVEANLLCDNSKYILGYDGTGQPERARRCFEAARDLHVEVFGGSDAPAARAVAAFFKNWNPDAAAQHPALKDYLDEIQVGNLVFRFELKYVHTNPDVLALAQEYRSRKGDGPEMQCLVTGKRGSIAVLHPSIKGVSSSNPMPKGAKLVSFDKPAFRSYGREQGYNAPVSEYAAFAYGTALNHLLSDSNRVKYVGDTTLVCWAESGREVYQDFWNMGVMGDAPEEIEQSVQSAPASLPEGRSVEWEGEELRADEHFYLLGLAPNAARLSVRFFLRDSFGGFMRNICAHERRLEIEHPPYKRNSLPLWQLLRATVNLNSRDKKPSPQLAGDMLRAVLTGERYPATLYNGVMLRIRAEREISYERAAIIKAYLIRNFGEEIPVKLDENCTNLPYVLGGLFCVLEEIQEAANPGINATIHDRYYTAAGSTPARVFPTLLNLAGTHLRKLKGEPGKRIALEKKLLEKTDKVRENFPEQLGQKDKGMFQLGYYHQKQSRYTKKEENNHGRSD